MQFLPFLVKFIIFSNTKKILGWEKSSTYQLKKYFFIFLNFRALNINYKSNNYPRASIKKLNTSLKFFISLRLKLIYNLGAHIKLKWSTRRFCHYILLLLLYSPQQKLCANELLFRETLSAASLLSI